MPKRLPFLFLFTLLSLSISLESIAQGERKAITFTGIVIGGDSLERLPNAYVSIPKAGKMVMADNMAYFAIPVFPGDSVEFSYLGFKKQYHLIPKDYNEETYSAVVSLNQDAIMLREAKVYLYNTEEQFRRGFLDMVLPDQAGRDELAKNTEQEYIQRMSAVTPNSPQTNFSYVMDQMNFGRESAANRNFVTTIPFLNPFAWGRLIKDIKNGGLKTKAWQKELSKTPRETLTRDNLIDKDSPYEPPKEEN